jgi:membrane associated rhomboid family serine protease
MLWLLPWDEDTHARHMPWATWTLVAINLVVFGAMLASTDIEAWTGYALAPATAQWWQFLTANFLHGGLMHLAGNMLFLLVFGDNIEDAFGPVPFLLLYFVGGLVGDLFFVSANASMTIPSVGASGCISALAGAYLVLYFSSTIGVRLMFLVFTLHVFQLRVLWVMLLWFGYDSFLTFSRHGVLPADEGGGVNYVAHGMGFAFGILVAVFARLYGVMRRYDTLAEGSPWLGYWPMHLEFGRRRRRAV